MYNKLLSECPVCEGRLFVTHLKCEVCETELNGQFVANEFARLPMERLDFLRTFLSCRGNLKEVEAELNISYPTVRARLDQLLEALHIQRLALEDEMAEPAVEKSEILAKIERGELTVEEAERALRSK